MIDPNEPAFPGGISATAKATDDAPPTQAGISIRAYLAAKAMQGILAGEGGNDIKTKLLASWSVECADALIAELNKEATP